MYRLRIEKERRGKVRKGRKLEWKEKVKRRNYNMIIVIIIVIIIRKERKRLSKGWVREGNYKERRREVIEKEEKIVINKINKEGREERIVVEGKGKVKAKGITEKG